MMDVQTTPPETTDDLSSLSWVQEELRRTLESAHKSLRRHLKESESQQASDLDAVDTALLRSARQQFHQGAGALELVGLPAGATLVRACEAAVQRLVAKPQKLTTEMVETIERASFALLEYLSRMLVGKPVSPIALFPQYRKVQELAAAERVHPADLWQEDWRWRELPPDFSVAPRQPDPQTRSELEAQVLGLMRSGSPAIAARLSELYAGLAAGAEDVQNAITWRLAAGFFEGQAQGLMRIDNYSKRVASRLLSQLRMVERGQPAASERLAQDLLFFCAQCESPGDGRVAPRLAAVRQVYGLAHHVPVDYEHGALGRHDPALIVQARKRVTAAKEAWASVAGGEMHRLAGLSEQFALMNDSVRKLYPSGQQLADELTAAAAQTLESDAPPPAPLAMEVATSVLYVEASLEDGDFDHPQLAGRVHRLADRIGAVRRGAPPEALEDWMEELYRRVSERQTMGSVVQELRASLAEAEKHIDQYFRDPTQRDVLIPAPPQLAAMRGVLSVLGMDQASAAVLRMHDEVDSLLTTEVDQERSAYNAVFERLAGNLGALGFLIDMLSVQPQLAKSLFVFEPAAGTLRPVMGRHKGATWTGNTLPGVVMPVEPRVIEQAQSLAHAAASDEVPVEEVARDLERLSIEARAADLPALAATVDEAQRKLDRALDAVDESAAREQLALAMNDFVVSSSEPIALDAEFPAPAAAPVAAPAPSSEVDDEEDAEMREIFLEEAREVLGNAKEALDQLVDEPRDVALLTTVRRGFHTLKGSGRMVGLNEFGEAAWACEQLYNARLADRAEADEALLGFTGEAFGYLSQWVEGIAAGDASRFDPAVVRNAADALRLRGELRPFLADATPLALPEGSEPVPAFAPTGLPVDLPSAADLDLSVPASASGLDFELDLGAYESAAPASAPLPAPATIELSLDALGESDGLLATEPLPLLDEDAKRVPAPEPGVELIDLDLDLDFSAHDTPAPLPEPEMPTELPAIPAFDELPPAPAAVDLPLVIDFGDALAADAAAEPADAAEASESTDIELPIAAADEEGEEQVKAVGPLRIGIPLFNIFLNEADDLSRRLTFELADWSREPQRPVGESAIALAHSLAGSSATVGFADLSQLARLLEHALSRSQAAGHGSPDECALFIEAGDEINHLLHQFAAGFLKSPHEDLMHRLAEHEAAAAAPIAEATALAHPAADEAPALPDSVFGVLGQPELKSLSALPEDVTLHAAARADALDADDDIDAIDAVDAELFPIFEEEGEELLAQLASRLRDWAHDPAQPGLAAACMRTLHTLKGGARLAGAMRLGEMAHRLETAIDHLLARGGIQGADIDLLQGRVDTLVGTFEALRQRDAEAYEAAQAAAAEPESVPAALSALKPMPAPAAPTEADIDLPLGDDAVAVSAPVPERAPIDWSRFVAAPAAAAAAAERPSAAASQSAVRVRAPLLERLVNQAGEVSITRSRIESELGTLKGALADLTDNLQRLREQLRDIELQAETQLASRLEAARAASEAFDPLESDRFTRFQELTRMMAESVNDVATVQRTLQRTLEATEDELAAQARLTRDLQDDLLRTRMVEFEGLSDRLYRVVRLAAKETGKQVRLDIVGGSIEVDRGVLDRMTGAFEHLLRNCVSHGIEKPEVRSAAGKDPVGTIMVVLTQEGNEVGVEFRDDGQGLDLLRIRKKGVAMGWLDDSAEYADAELANLIFTPGFSTADTVTELAGRGIGMDVVRSEVNAMGGRIETATDWGQGTSFKLVLPLTTAVTQVVMLRCGDTTVAVPSTLVEIVRRATPAEVERAYGSGAFAIGEQSLPFFWLGSLLQMPGRAQAAGRMLPVVVIRSAKQRIVIHVDEVFGNQEVVVKNLGPQLSRMPGLAGMTLLASGRPALIYNPVALATLYGSAARAAAAAELDPQTQALSAAAEAEAAAPRVLVVDDSLTVRRVTQRLLVREGYRVTLAKDGLEALERLAEETPNVVLSDIEMPRMDGFDLVRNLRGDARWRELPVIMITSRIAQKHRDLAGQLGVDHYLGKPYAEDELLALIQRYVAAAAVAAN